MTDAFLKSRELLSDIPGIAWVDKDNRQLEDYDSKPSVPPNSALIRVAVLRTQTVAEGVQKWFVNITIRFWVNVVKSETSNKAPDEALARSLAHYDTYNAIYNKFQDYTDDEFEDFNMESAAEEERRDGLLVMRWVFSTSFLVLKDNV